MTQDSLVLGLFLLHDLLVPRRNQVIVQLIFSEVASFKPQLVSVLFFLRSVVAKNIEEAQVVTFEQGRVSFRDQVIESVHHRSFERLVAFIFVDLAFEELHQTFEIETPDEVDSELSLIRFSVLFFVLDSV